MAGRLDWQDTNIRTIHCPDHTVVDALCELVMNSMDAAPGNPELSLLQGYPSVLRVEDSGPGMTLDSFGVGASGGDEKVVERFGLGLKDALSVLIREGPGGPNGAHVTITSSLGDYKFDLRPTRVSESGAETIWVRGTPLHTSAHPVPVSDHLTSHSYLGAPLQCPCKPSQ
jgi:hypothetical protein